MLRVEKLHLFNNFRESILSFDPPMLAVIATILPTVHVIVHLYIGEPFAVPKWAPNSNNNTLKKNNSFNEYLIQHFIQHSTKYRFVTQVYNKLFPDKNI